MTDTRIPTTAYYAVNVGCAELAGPYSTEEESRRTGEALGFGTLVTVNGNDAAAYDAAVRLAQYPTPVVVRFAAPVRSTPETLTLTLPRHGTFTVSVYQLDGAIDRYLPANCPTLHAIIQERTGLDYSDVHSVSALVLVLADMDGTEG